MTDNSAHNHALDLFDPMGARRDAVDAFALFRSAPLVAQNEGAYKSATEMLIGIFQGLGWTENSETLMRTQNEQRNNYILARWGHPKVTPETIAAKITAHEKESKPANAFDWSVSAALAGPNGGIAFISATQSGGISDAGATAYCDASVWDEFATVFACNDLLASGWNEVTETRKANGSHNLSASSGSPGGRDGYHDTLRVTRRAPADIENAARLGIPVTALSVSRHWHCRYL